jgi:hypothetical protein
MKVGFPDGSEDFANLKTDENSGPKNCIAVLTNKTIIIDKKRIAVTHL